MDTAQNAVPESVFAKAKHEHNKNTNPKPSLEPIVDSNHEPNPLEQNPEIDTIDLLSIIRRAKLLLGFPKR